MERKDRAGAEGRSDVQARSTSRRHQRIEALNEKYRKDYGWGTEDPDDYGTKRNLDELQSRQRKPQPLAESKAKAERLSYLEELMPTRGKMSTNFDPEAMRVKANQMLRDGTMPPEEQLAAALDRIREEYAAEILKAREQDQQENSSDTSRSIPNSSRRPEEPDSRRY
jgi:hypothetical protein